MFFRLDYARFVSFGKAEEELKFTTIERCHRSAAEQRYIWATLRLWKQLPEPRRARIRRLIERVARTPEEGRALFDVAVRGVPPQAESERTGVPLLRIYELRRELYALFEI